MEAGIPLTEGLGSSRPTALTALQRKREEEVQAKPSAQASSSCVTAITHSLEGH